MYNTEHEIPKPHPLIPKMGFDREKPRDLLLLANRSTPYVFKKNSHGAPERSGELVTWSCVLCMMSTGLHVLCWTGLNCVVQKCGDAQTPAGNNYRPYKTLCFHGPLSEYSESDAIGGSTIGKHELKMSWYCIRPVLLLFTVSSESCIFYRFNSCAIKSPCADQWTLTGEISACFFFFQTA